VDERYAFRFPRRAVAIPGTEREIAVLPKLAPLLPLPVPRPAFVGSPTNEYPWPFFGCEPVPGVETADAALDDPARLEIALELARFLRKRDAQLLRARVLWIQLCAVLARYGHVEGLEGVEREGLAGLDRAATD
jgi:Phosphotransferase enzyme family